MHIYLVELQNDEYGEDRWIDSVFTTYRFATEYLLDEGYEMCPIKDDYTEEWDIHFLWEKLDEKGKFITDWEIAKIIKMEIKK